MPELIVNPFDSSGYDLATMTNAINLLEVPYGWVNALGLFAEEGITTRTVILEEKAGTITLLPNVPVGGPATVAKRDKGTLRSLVVPHFPYSDRILPSDIQGRREFGTGSTATSLASMINSRLVSMKRNHMITKEHLLVGAVKGVIYDADGSTVLANLFTEFGITKKQVDFDLDTETTDVAAKCREVLRHIEDNLGGDVMTGVRCMVSDTFFDALIAHPNVEKFYTSHVAALELAGVGMDPRKNFNFGGITWSEYRGKASDPDGNTVDFIADDYGHAFPVGSMDMFKLFYAPANLMETANTVGMEMYARQTMDPQGRWVDVYTESNTLPVCRRPGALVEVYT